MFFNIFSRPNIKYKIKYAKGRKYIIDAERMNHLCNATCCSSWMETKQVFNNGESASSALNSLKVFISMQSLIMIL